MTEEEMSWLEVIKATLEMAADTLKRLRVERDQARAEVARLKALLQTAGLLQQ